MHNTSPSSGDHLASISRFLSRPLVATLFAFHPNDPGDSLFSPPSEWEEWWDWPGQVCDGRQGPEQEDPWLILLRYYDSCLSGHRPSEHASLIPLVLRSLITDACKLALPRDIGQVYPGHDSTSKTPHHPRDPKTKTQVLPGMSPKKAHEVAQVVGYLDTLMSPGSPMCSIRHVVDIGAGQAYLSRTLRDQLDLHVLALDWSEVQTQGAARRDASKMTRKAARRRRAGADDSAREQASRIKQSVPGVTNSSLTYVTTSIDPDSLVSSTKAWLENIPPSSAGVHAPAQVTPVLFVALHACGSLTPDILRAFASLQKPSSSVASTSTPWMPRGAVIVGCCYNMMRSEDFPLSRALRSCSPDLWVDLSPSHLQLAAQVPSQWTRSQQTLKEARFALRKIVWRALLQDTFKMRQEPVDEGDPGTSTKGDNTTGTGTRLERIGRLNDAAYADWGTFCNVVRTKLHLQPRDLPTTPSTRSERRVEVFHVLRCILGPVVESFILLDRLAWMSEELDGSSFTAHLVNLFDQASGSGRNIAIAILPNHNPQS